MRKDDFFEITLKNEKTDAYIRLGYVLAGINLVPFVVFFFYRDSLFAGAAGIISAVIYFIIRFFISRKEHQGYLLDENIFFLLAAAWLLENSVMAVLVLATGVLFRIALSPLRFIFTKEFVRKDFFPKKSYQWDQFDSVVLKDGFLTLNFNDDKLLQAKTEDLPREVVIAFNQFVHEMLSQQHQTYEA